MALPRQHQNGTVKRWTSLSPVVEMRGLSLRGHRPILDGIDLRLEAGQNLGHWPIGCRQNHNPALLAGLEMPSAGELHLLAAARTTAA